MLKSIVQMILVQMHHLRLFHLVSSDLWVLSPMELLSFVEEQELSMLAALQKVLETFAQEMLSVLLLQVEAHGAQDQKYQLVLSMTAI